jgi:hypothetical protein
MALRWLQFGLQLRAARLDSSLETLLAKKAKQAPVSGAALLGAAFKQRKGKQDDSDERTTSIGLFLYARAYAEAGVHLHRMKLWTQFVPPSKSLPLTVVRTSSAVALDVALRGETDQLASTHFAGTYYRAAFSAAAMCGMRRSLRSVKPWRLEDVLGKPLGQRG